MSGRARRELRAILAGAGASLASGDARGSAGPEIEHPFGSAEPVEGAAVTTRRVKVGVEPRDAAFADGVQRFTVEAWLGVTPVVRASVGAAVLVREAGQLRPAVEDHEEFVVAPLGLLPDVVRGELERLDFPVYDAAAADRQHPMVDLRTAALYVEKRRAAAERTVVRAFRRQYPRTWLVIDGALRGFEFLGDDPHVIGLIKSHETQFLAGVDLNAALTLPAEHRTTVFRRHGSEGDPVFSWYLRLWEWHGRDLLHGLIRLERPTVDAVLEEVDEVSAWMLSERAPVADDQRWDRLVYPMHGVETYLRARAGGWR